MVLELDAASFTAGAGVQDEVPLAHQGKLLGVLDRCALSPLAGQPSRLPCLYHLHPSNPALQCLPLVMHACCKQGRPGVGKFCRLGGGPCCNFAEPGHALKVAGVAHSGSHAFFPRENFLMAAMAGLCSSAGGLSKPVHCQLSSGRSCTACTRPAWRCCCRLGGRAHAAFALHGPLHLTASRPPKSAEERFEGVRVFGI